jgi:RNA polymerase sigma factor (sigma-70 family)
MGTFTDVGCRPVAKKKISEILEKIYRRRLSSWRRFARSFMGNDEDAEDVVQEAIRRMLSADPPLRTESQVDRYVFTAMRTCALKMLKKRSRLVLVEQMDLEHDRSAEGVLALLVAIEEGYEGERLTQRVLREVKRLPPTERRAVELLVLRPKPLKLREAAEREGVAISTMHNRLQAALKRLADVIRDDPGEEGKDET